MKRFDAINIGTGQALLSVNVTTNAEEDLSEIEFLDAGVEAFSFTFG